MIPPIVDLTWLREHPEAVVADVRYYLDGRSGREAYLRGHLPGAVFVDMDHDLARHGAPAAEGRHPLPEPAAFARSMAAAGIGEGDTVVAYDDAGGVMAARLVWMLRASGHAAALLDGGIQGYDGVLDPTPVTRPPATFTTRPWSPDRLATIDEAAGNAGSVVIDARPRDRFRGENEVLDPRPGHIPGAHNVPCRENVDSAGRVLPVGTLRERFVDIGVTEGTDVVSYCGSGVTACHNLLVLEHAGLGPGRLFPGSWSAWSHTDRPAATGD